MPNQDYGIEGELETGGTEPDEIAVARVQIARQGNLLEIDLSDLGLTTVPEVVGNLRFLKAFRSVNNPLMSLPDSFASLQNLRSCVISGAEFKSLPEVFRHLPLLETLILSGGLIQALPGWIKELKTLKVLQVSSNRLHSLPRGIGELKYLERLNLTHNQLKKLPDSLRNLPRLKLLLLHGNVDLSLPQEVLGPTSEELNYGVVSAEPRAILDYYSRIRVDTRPLNEAKLILVGRGEVGKTCLVNRLVRDTFVDTSKTQGIRIEQWPINIGNETVKLHIWDFGGQEIMHATHQFFLTQRSLYLLVLAGRQGGEDADAEYWLQLIESFGGDSPVIVVLNKIAEHSFNLDYRGLRAKYPSIRDFARVDCKARTGFEELHKMIRNETGALKELRVPFPASWVSIKDRLAGMAEHGENYVSFERYRALCGQLDLEDESAQEDLAGHLHALGIALNYKDDPRLNDTHVLSPHWVTNGIYSLLNWAELERRAGELRFEDLGRVLHPTAYPKGKHLFLLDLMKKFEVCFEYPDDVQRRYLVPQLLGKEQPAATADFDLRECLNFQYQYNFVPEGLLPRFIVRTHQLSNAQGRWRTGVLLEFEYNRALVKADVQDRKVFISVTGAHGGARRRLLAVIRSDFERIHSDIKKLQVEAMVPVPGNPEWVVPFEELQVLERDKVRKYKRVFGGRSKELDVQDLLNGVDIEGSRFRSKGNREQMEAVPVFISYSHKDETLRSELETHLKLLHREGAITVWTDRKIGSGEEWKGEIDRNLEAAELVLLLVSADFIASDYCYDVEMNRALERHEAGEATVIPIILRDLDWRSAPFAKFKALPQDGRAVTLWPNRDTAWKEVSVSIRGAIEARRAGWRQ